MKVAKVEILKHSHSRETRCVAYLRFISIDDAIKDFNWNG